ncbi:glucose 1-dehydrogenase [Altererythrobacter aurantiacus]|uniref:Glucose 1-dehydrogenase n=1 Tax=Parapontixanthobacter aurantiacus TaxID=1463599 RepID=A0A844ZJ38_9SPHN|nr:glucose 1-dehydrogenase [Parapontixanthobacter aurantiacus]MXO86927.1 glucose 1-dehydrogenase [Parapontixanthobacter aurantiacus]
MSGNLTGRAALVTGGDTGIGEAISRELATRGANVAINWHSEAGPAEELADEISRGGTKAFGIGGDVSREEDASRLVEETVARLGRIDILVSNAGIQIDAPALEMKADEFRKVIEVNLTGQFLVARTAAKHFIEQGVDEGRCNAGVIVCMSSVHDTVPWAGHANYAAAKGGVNMLMKTLAQEFAEHRIRVVGISPGAIKTDINRQVWSDAGQAAKLRELIPYGRIGEVEDVAKPVGWLCSDEADYVTGTTLYVDGGMTLYPGFIGNG